MTQELKASGNQKPQPQNPCYTTAATTEPPIINIYGILASAFCTNLKQKKNKYFTTSLYEIDQELQERSNQSQSEDKRQDQETELQWLARLLPSQYSEYANVFSKDASDILLPHRSYNHKIQLENDAKPGDLGYSPLYHQTTAELEAIKKYLVENLDKGFIKSSQAPFVAPVLFVKKANGSLRFCINYQKLNLMTRKDRYPLPLINETLARLAKAKIYTKLDIRQAFH